LVRVHQAVKLKFFIKDRESGDDSENLTQVETMTTQRANLTGEGRGNPDEIS